MFVFVFPPRKPEISKFVLYRDVSGVEPVIHIHKRFHFNLRASADISAESKHGLRYVNKCTSHLLQLVTGTQCSMSALI